MGVIYGEDENMRRREYEKMGINNVKTCPTNPLQ
jgi:hypothetical protein